MCDPCAILHKVLHSLQAFQPASSFMHDINEDWLAYNAKNCIAVGLKDVRMIYTPKSNTIEDLLEVEVIGSVTTRVGLPNVAC